MTRQSANPEDLHTPINLVISRHIEAKGVLRGSSALFGSH